MRLYFISNKISAFEMYKKWIIHLYNALMSEHWNESFKTWASIYFLYPLFLPLQSRHFHRCTVYHFEKSCHVDDVCIMTITRVCIRNEAQLCSETMSMQCQNMPWCHSFTCSSLTYNSCGLTSLHYRGKGEHPFPHIDEIEFFYRGEQSLGWLRWIDPSVLQFSML